MDKSTLSNYGWIVIAVLVLSVMIALATPFGGYIQAGIKNTLFGLIETGDNALGIIGQTTKEDDTDKNEYDHNDIQLHPSNTIPQGAVYIIAETNTTLVAGDKFPEQVKKDDIYKYGDYIYTYSSSTVPAKGWHVSLNEEVTDRTKETYGNILESINSVPIKALRNLFSGCRELKISPVIPLSTESLFGTYYSCRNLQSPPKIPNKVNDMKMTFYDCWSFVDLGDFIIPDSVKNMNATFYQNEGLAEYNGKLKTAPVIPETVTDITFIFQGCVNLTGDIIFNTSTTKCNWCFGGIDFDKQNIRLKGSSTMLDKYGAQGENYCDICDGTCYGFAGTGITHNDTIPQNGIYTSVNGTIFRQGDAFPEFQMGDTYKYEDYQYTALKSGWKVKCINNVARPSEIISTINRKHILNLDETFADCTNLLVAPAIPNAAESFCGTFKNCISLVDISNIKFTERYSTVLYNYAFENCSSLTSIPTIPKKSQLYYTFAGCSSLVDISDYTLPSDTETLSYVFKDCTSLTNVCVIPDSVILMEGTFMNCSALIDAPVIPENVECMNYTFSGCNNLSNIITINAQSEDITFKGMFDGTMNTIYLNGNSQHLNSIADGWDNVKIQPSEEELGLTEMIEKTYNGTIIDGYGYINMVAYASEGIFTSYSQLQEAHNNIDTFDFTNLLTDYANRIGTTPEELFGDIETVIPELKGMINNLYSEINAMFGDVLNQHGEMYIGIQVSETGNIQSTFNGYPVYTDDFSPVE